VSQRARAIVYWTCVVIIAAASYFSVFTVGKIAGMNEAAAIFRGEP
jgi:hypothetical protein